MSKSVADGNHFLGVMKFLDFESTA